MPSGTPVSAADIYNLQNPATVHLANVTGQAMASSTVLAQCTLPTVVTASPLSAIADTTNNQALIQVAGLYQFFAQVAWPSNSTGYRACYIYKNNSSTGLAIVSQTAASGVITRLQLATPIVRLTAGDTIRLGAAQNSGSTLTLDTSHGGVWLAGSYRGA